MQRQLISTPLISTACTFPFITSNCPTLTVTASRAFLCPSHATILPYFGGCFETLPYIIEKPIDLFFDWMGLIKTVAVDTDDEVYVLEVLTAAYRRIISSYILLESGFVRESIITVRNYIELMLIAIDITYNRLSLEEWRKSDKTELIVDSRDNWYFKKANICARI
jgi:hypothetical protein